MPLILFASSLLVALFAADAAYAHVGHGTAFSLSAGFAHPLNGLDHLLAMFAVGLLAAQLGGRAVWLVPAAFMAAMTGGALSGFAGVSLPGVELGISISIVAIALPVAFALGMPAQLAMAYVGVFAIFHGYAHGAELPANAAAAPYMAGFVLATALIHAAGVGTGVTAARLFAGRHRYALRLAGGAVVAAGMALAVA